MCGFDALVACSTRSSVCIVDEPDVAGLVFVFNPKWWLLGTIVNDDDLVIAFLHTLCGDALNASLEHLLG